MQLEKQVVSLELAKKLKELGVKQESLFYWVGDHSNPDTPWTIENWRITDKDNRLKNWQSDTPISAFTVAELFEDLGKENINVYYNGGKVNIAGIDGSYSEDTLADALAMYYINLAMYYINLIKDSKK